MEAKQKMTTGELATYQQQRVLEKIPGQLQSSFLIFLTLGSIKQNRTVQVLRKEEKRKFAT